MLGASLLGHWSENSDDGSVLFKTYVYAWDTGLSKCLEFKHNVCNAC